MLDHRLTINVNKAFRVQRHYKFKLHLTLENINIFKINRAKTCLTKKNSKRTLLKNLLSNIDLNTKTKSIWKTEKYSFEITLTKQR